ncbi:MAG TPA: class I SAM-dependent methyltransferase [Actinomycetota bacterium]|nr:class I SAM-dependent methyltransferase [Actinomycetota bacterium]
MRTESLAWLACPAPGCAGPLSPGGRFEIGTSPSDPAELVEAVLCCNRCEAEYPVILGVALLENDLQAYLGAFWEEIARCGDELAGAGVSRRMRSYLGIPSAFSGQAGPAPAGDSGAEWSVSPYLQAHFDPGSLTGDLPGGWWREAVTAHRASRLDPYSLLLGSVRELPGSPAGLALDVGSSVGRGAAELAKLYRYSVGVDRSFRAVLAARRLLLRQPSPLDRYSVEIERGRWEPRGLDPPPEAANLDFVVASGAALPVSAEGAQCVAGLNVLCAVPEPRGLIGEFARVLAPGGVLALSSPYWADADEGGRSPFSGGGPEFLAEALDGRFEVVEEHDMVPWLVRLARRRWNVYLCHCVVATRC